ncbi:MAG: IS66 family insertion sequence element accessory protein TnpB [Rhodopila sp.]
MLVQQGLGEDPFDGALYAFRGRRAGLIKLLWHDGVGLCRLVPCHRPSRLLRLTFYSTCYCSSHCQPGDRPEPGRSLSERAVGAVGGQLLCLQSQLQRTRGSRQSSLCGR